MSAPHQLNLGTLTARCQEETAKYYARLGSDDVYCLEIFRRALQEQSNPARDSLVECYRPLMRIWFYKHRKWQLILTAGGDAEDAGSRAFMEFFETNDRRVQRTGTALQVGSLQAILAYLRLCLHTAIVDALHEITPETPELPLEDWTVLPGADIGEDFVDKEHARAIWQAVQGCIPAGKETELHVVYLRFGCGWSPERIFNENPGIAGDIDDIYAILRRFRSRFRRKYKNLDTFYGNS